MLWQEALFDSHPASPLVEIPCWWSHLSRGFTFVSPFGVKYRKNNTLPKPRNRCLELCIGHAKTYTFRDGSRVSHLLLTPGHPI